MVMPNSSTGTSSPRQASGLPPTAPGDRGDGHQQQHDQPRQAGQRPALAIAHVDAAQQKGRRRPARSRPGRGRSTGPAAELRPRRIRDRSRFQVLQRLAGLGQRLADRVFREDRLHGIDGTVRSLVWSRRRRRSAWASAAASARQTGGRPPAASCGFFRSRVLNGRPVADQHVGRRGGLRWASGRPAG